MIDLTSIITIRAHGTRTLSHAYVSRRKSFHQYYLFLSLGIGIQYSQSGLSVSTVKPSFCTFILHRQTTFPAPLSTKSSILADNADPVTDAQEELDAMSASSSSASPASSAFIEAMIRLQDNIDAKESIGKHLLGLSEAVQSRKMSKRLIKSFLSW